MFCCLCFSVTPEELEASQAAKRDMYAALKARKEALEEAVKKKTEELKLLCIKEGVSVTPCCYSRLELICDNPPPPPPPPRKKKRKKRNVLIQVHKFNLLCIKYDVSVTPFDFPIYV